MVGSGGPPELQAGTASSHSQPVGPRACFLTGKGGPSEGAKPVAASEKGDTKSPVILTDLRYFLSARKWRTLYKKCTRMPCWLECGVIMRPQARRLSDPPNIPDSCFSPGHSEPSHYIQLTTLGCSWSLGWRHGQPALTRPDPCTPFLCFGCLQLCLSCCLQDSWGPHTSRER